MPAALRLARQVAGRLLLAALGIAMALALGEGAARVAWLLLPPEPPPPRRPPPPAGLRQLTNIFELASPNVVGVIDGVVHRTNSGGMRGHEIAREKPPGTYRIAVGGDSWTMGMGVPEEDIYPVLLEAALNAGGGDRRYEVLNLGLGGLNAEQVLHRLEMAGLPYDPDLLVYAFDINDLEGPLYRKSRSDAVLRAEKTRLATFARSPSYLVRTLGPRWQSLSAIWWPEPGSYVWELRDNYENNPQAWAVLLRSLGRLAGMAAARGICGHVFILTDLSYLNFLHPLRRYYDQVEAAAHDRGLTVTQSFPYFRGRDERALWVNIYDHHPNAAGHRLLVRALEDGLARLPARCGGPAAHRAVN